MPLAQEQVRPEPGCSLCEDENVLVKRRGVLVESRLNLFDLDSPVTTITVTARKASIYSLPDTHVYMESRTSTLEQRAMLSRS